ncbi:MAG: TonB-dependent receptor [Gemmatimonadaceae bacterium]|nr:TonB-dependent receptor [Gemmatimonadaceae bacterium]
MSRDLSTPRPYRGLGGAAVRLLLPAPLLAATPDPPDSTVYTAPPVVVTAVREAAPLDRLPLAVSAVGRERFAPGEKSLSLAEALRQVPGLHVAERNNPSQGPRLMARGLGARAAFGVRGVKVLLDGVPLTTPDGQTQLGNIDLAAAGRVEVLRGPNSSLYGNAGGGVVAVHTRSPETAGVRVKPRLVAGSDGLWLRRLALAGGGRHSFHLSVRQLDLDGYRDHSEARVRGLNAVVRSRLRPAWELVWVLNLYDAPYLLNPSSLIRGDARDRPRFARGFIVRQGASKQTRQSQGGITLRHTGGNGRTELTLYGVDRGLLNPIPGAVIDLERRAGGLRAVHGRTLRLGNLPGSWKAGLDLEVQRDDRREHGNEGLADPDTEPARVPESVALGALLQDQEESVSSAGAFAALALHPRPGWTLSLGGRLDRYGFEVSDRLLDDGDDSGTRSLSRLSPSAGLGWQVTPRNLLYASYGTAFQTPTTVELGNRPDGGGGFNPDLGPESVASFEVGLRGRDPSGRLTWDAAVYRLAVDGMLIPFQVDDPASEAVYYRNAGRTSSRGLEAALAAHRGSWRAELSYTYMDFLFDDYVIRSGEEPVQLSGNRVPGLPPRRLLLDLAADLPFGLRAEGETEWVAGYYANDHNGPPPGSAAAPTDFRNDTYVVTGLRLTAPLTLGFGGVRLFTGIDNLFDAAYNGSITPNAFGARFFEPASGRTWYAGLEADLGPP